MSGVVVGLDAGASKTRAFAVTRDGATVGRGAGGGGNLLTSPDPGGSYAAALHEALAGRTPEAVVLSCAGGDREADRARGEEILRGIVGPEVRVAVTHDAKAALYAGNPQGCGVVLISGTGSVAYGRNEEGDELRAGGWGYLAGDEGSAVWLGLEALRAVAHDWDGRGSPTRISEQLRRELGAQDFHDVLPHLYGRPHPAPAILAGVRALANAAAESDAIAVRIVERGAHELARAAAVVSLGLRLADGPVYLAGGAFESVSLLQHALRRELVGMLPRAAVEAVHEEPAMGAARLAAQLAWGVG
ncbi:MAG TPA: BadF/BadG/BcrA/BcrD ATPase family protein [Candidatus Limnocylindria bacterium]|nr:BadF/BadG/BcrA/BcrD ATPase family protein [Candidatus Limnocylindria bacterium]